MNTISIYHQCGHNDIWNFDIYNKDSVGDGLILAPKMRTKKGKLDFLDEEIRKNSFFDPQFYQPRSNLKKLSEYDFFPNVICNGYDTIDYMDLAYISAEKCIEFQIQQEYKFIIIPTIVAKDTHQSYFESLVNLYIEPFIKVIKDKNINNKEILLTVVIQDYNLNDENYKNELLNLVTRYAEITGIYLIAGYNGTNKRIKDINFIFNFLKFINILKENEMYVHIGYCDIEGILYSLANIDSVSIGTYENLRRFDIKNFEEKNYDSHQSPPNKRIYSNKLFQWIDFNYIGALNEFDEFDILFDKNKYITLNLPDEINWHFKFPELYKHYMTSIYNQYKSLPSNYNERFEFIKEQLLDAIRINNKLNEFGILFDSNNDGSHLHCWVTAINKFSKYLKGEVCNV